MTIKIRVKDRFSMYKISKDVSCSINTITNETNLGRNTQIRGENCIH